MTDQNIRSTYRKSRRDLSEQQQQINSRLLARNLHQFFRFKHRLKIAAYLATQGEISLDLWITQAHQHNIYLPMLYEAINPQLRFAPISEFTRWKKNRFNITEPDTHWSHALHASKLDIILLPLVAFDLNGNRMGMGGGYYDRSLAFRKNRKHWKKPLLVGIAHSLQKHQQLTHQAWDIPLDAVVTENEIHYFKNN